MSKQGRNGFYYFMLDFQKKQGSGKFRSMKEVADAAGPHWKTLSKEQKNIYTQMATEAKGALKAYKLNSDNRPIDEIEEMQRQEEEWRQNMRDDIQSSLSMAMRENLLDSHMFFIIHINSFCQHEHSKEYSPCEIAIAGFSLKDGVLTHNVYHSMIQPGALPLGYASIAQQHANETHQIDLPRIGGDDNQEEVFIEIIEFISSKKRHGSAKFPPLYAANKNLPMVRSVFDTWCNRFSYRPEHFQIYDLQCMFRILRNTIAGCDAWQSETMSHQEIEKDVYNYTPEIACEFHQMSDVLTFCSRSIVVRYAYIICDNCCKDANIQMIPGCHVPQNARIVSTHEEFKAPRSKSSRRTASTRYTTDSVREDTSDAETVISIGRSSVWENSSSSAVSINFPELGKRNSSPSDAFYDGPSPQESSNPMSGSYAGATSFGAGSSGLSKKKSVLPFNLTENMGSVSLSQDSLDSHFPAIGTGRARSNASSGSIRGRGRGNPFKKPSSNA